MTPRSAPTKRATPPYLKRRAWWFVALTFGVAIVQIVLVFGAARSGSTRAILLASTLPSLATFAVTGWFILAWRRDGARARATDDLLCWHCGYHLKGLTTSGICPECGKAFDHDELRRLWGMYRGRS